MLCFLWWWVFFHRELRKLLSSHGNRLIHRLQHLRLSRRSFGVLRINRTNFQHLCRRESDIVRDQTCCQSAVGPYVFARRSRLNWQVFFPSRPTSSNRGELNTQGLRSSCGRDGHLYEWSSGGVREAWVSDLGRFAVVSVVAKAPKPRVCRTCVAVHE